MPQLIKRIVVIAGEESGDLHAAAFIRELTATQKNLHISGIGGKHMQEAGVTLISDLARFGVTGLSEVIRHARVIRRAFNDIKAHLSETKPDLLILVDYPGFNLRLAKYAKQVLGLRVLYYISPQIWAWKAKRIHTIKACVDHMAVILPFEKALYEQAGVPVSFVGHPLVESVHHDEESESTRQRLGLPMDKRLIALLPGSRTHEIERHMPVLKDTALNLVRSRCDLHFVIPVAGTIDPTLIQSYFKNTPIPYTLIQGQAIKTVAASDCVVVASGTASLECALLGKPMCIIYKASVLTYIAAMKLIHVKFLGLCNLLKNAMIVPELLQYDCNAIELTRAVLELLNDDEMKQRMLTRLNQLKLTLSAHAADCSVTDIILNLIGSAPIAHPAGKTQA